MYVRMYVDRHVHTYECLYKDNYRTIYNVCICSFAVWQYYFVRIFVFSFCVYALSFLLLLHFTFAFIFYLRRHYLHVGNLFRIVHKIAALRFRLFQSRKSTKNDAPSRTLKIAPPQQRPVLIKNPTSRSRILSILGQKKLEFSAADAPLHPNRFQMIFF
jgi:hypothetical protein